MDQAHYISWSDYKVHLLHTSEDGFIIRTSYIKNTSTPCPVQCDRAAANIFTSVRDWGRQLCRHASRRKKLPFCFAPLHKGMECEDHWCLGLFLSEFKRHYEKLVKGIKCSRTSSPTKNNHNFRPAIPTHATNQLRTTQVAFQPGDSKVVTIDQEIAICLVRIDK